MKAILTISTLLLMCTLNAQNSMNDSLPYQTIPPAYETFTPGTVVSRMVDGLGFRFYWATEGLTEANYNYFGII